MAWTQLQKGNILPTKGLAVVQALFRIRGKPLTQKTTSVLSAYSTGRGRQARSFIRRLSKKSSVKTRMHDGNSRRTFDRAVTALYTVSVGYTFLLFPKKEAFIYERTEEIKQAMAVRVPKEVILSYFYPETSVVRMMEIRRRYE